MESSEISARLTEFIRKTNSHESTALRVLYIHMYKGMFSFFVSTHGRSNGVKENILLRLDCLEDTAYYKI